LEYCDPEKAIEREQHYLDMLNPEYNVLKVAGSSLGFKHSLENIEKMKNRIWTAEHKAKRSEHLKRIHESPEYKAKVLEQLNRLNGNTDFQEKRLEHLKRLHENGELQANRLKKVKEKSSKPVEICDLQTGETTQYLSRSEAARAIGVSRESITQGLKQLSDGQSAVFFKKKRYKLLG